MTDTPQTLDDLWRMADTALTQGAADRKHPARHPVLATLSPDGPQQRILVLRRWRDGVARLETDAATAKCAELTADPRCALHVWVPKQSLQIRIAARATIRPGNEEDWAAIPDAARRVYGGTPPTGTTIARPEDHDATGDPARHRVLTLAAERVEVLHLGREMHLRALFARADDGWQGAWIAP